MTLYFELVCTNQNTGEILNVPAIYHTNKDSFKRSVLRLHDNVLESVLNNFPELNSTGYGYQLYLLSKKKFKPRYKNFFDDYVFFHKPVGFYTIKSLDLLEQIVPDFTTEEAPQ